MLAGRLLIGACARCLLRRAPRGARAGGAEQRILLGIGVSARRRRGEPSLGARLCVLERARARAGALALRIGAQAHASLAAARRARRREHVALLVDHHRACGGAIGALDPHQALLATWPAAPAIETM